ncbi:hypothetical protein BGZ76_001861, partial [Entomortierella beljakovae]
FGAALACTLAVKDYRECSPNIFLTGSQQRIIPGEECDIMSDVKSTGDITHGE